MELHWKPFLALSIFLASFCLSGFAVAEAIKFEKQTITLAGKKIVVEVAKTDAQRQQGLMNRKSLPAQQGMLFIFEQEETRGFWMKNTLIELSIGYFNKDRILVDVQEMVPLSPMEARPITYTSAKPAMYALEMNKGWFAKNNVKIGQKFEFHR